MSKHANALWASAAIGLALTGTAVAQTSPNNNDNNDTKNRNGTGTTDDSGTPTTPPAPTPTTTTTDANPNTPPSTSTSTSTTSTDATGTAGANGTTVTTAVPGQTSTPGVAGSVSAEGALTVPAPPPPPVQSPSMYYTQPPAPTTTIIHEHDRGYSEPESAIGVVISAGGGAGGFVSDQLRNTTNVGGDWDVRASIATRSLLTLEGSYIGSAQSISALGLSNGATLVGNGAQGDLRLNGTFNFPVQPFIYAGAAWRRYTLTNMNGQNLSDVRSSDDVLEIPMGVGIASRFGRAILDVRGEFRAVTNEDLLPQVMGAGNANMNRWDTKATIGLEF